MRVKQVVKSMHVFQQRQQQHRILKIFFYSIRLENFAWFLQIQMPETEVIFLFNRL